jgi:hypothetical protein
MMEHMSFLCLRMHFFFLPHCVLHSFKVLEK